MISAIKDWLYKRKLNGHIKSHKRHMQAQHWNAVKTVMLVGSDMSRNELKTVTDWLGKEKKQVESLIYTQAETLEAMPDKTTLLSKSECNFYEIPTDEKVRPFLNAKPELLICLDTQPGKTVQYLIALSSAKLKTGFYGDHAVHLDLCIEDKSGKSNPLELVKGVSKLLHRVIDEKEMYETAN